MKLITYSVNTNENARGKTETAKHSVADGWTEKTSTVADFLDHAAIQGNAVMSGVLTNGYKAADNFKRFCIAIVDIDNKGDGNPTMSFDEAMGDPWLQDHAICMWSSPNDGRHDPDAGYFGQDRYRILFKLKEDLRICDKRFNSEAHRADTQKVKKLLDTLHRNIDGGDEGMAWANCIFGTIGARNVHTFDEENVLDVETLGIDSEPAAKPAVVSSHSSFSGSTEQSVANLRDKFLPVIPSDSHETWKSVGVMLGNIAYHDLDDQTCLELFQEWSLKDYPESNPDENERIFYRAFENPGTGSSFSSLKALAIEHGYEPKQYKEDEPFNPVEAFGISEGYKAGDVLVAKSAVNEPPSQAEINLALLRVDEKPKATQIRMILDELYGDTNKIKFNELTRQIELLGRPMPAHEFDVAHHIVDEWFGIMSGAEAAQSALKRIAHKNSYHPVKNYLEFLENCDDIEDIDLSLVSTRCLGVDDPLSVAQVTAWLCGAVSKAINDGGSKFIEVLTLVSPRQGIGKSEFFKSLASPDWFSDSFAQTGGDKDQILILHRAWINEISEVDQFATVRRDFKAMKGLVSTTTDMVRVPYGKVVEEMPRRFALSATSNATSLFAGDDEQRRFWTIEVNPTTSCGRLDIQWLQENRDRIWKAAVKRYRELGDDAFKLTTEQRAETILKNQEEYSHISNYFDTINHFLETHDIRAITTQEVCANVLNLPDPPKGKVMEVSHILRKLGYERKKNYTKHGEKFSAVFVHSDRKVDYHQSMKPKLVEQHYFPATNQEDF